MREAALWTYSWSRNTSQSSGSLAGETILPTIFFHESHEVPICNGRDLSDRFTESRDQNGALGPLNSYQY
jgi:hypothetical protein